MQWRKNFRTPSITPGLSIRNPINLLIWFCPDEMLPNCPRSYNIMATSKSMYCCHWTTEEMRPIWQHCEQTPAKEVYENDRLRGVPFRHNAPLYQACEPDRSWTTSHEVAFFPSSWGSTLPNTHLHILEYLTKVLSVS